MDLMNKILDFRVTERKELSEYLDKYPEIWKIIEKAFILAYKEFNDPGVQFSLEMFHDPEGTDTYPTLYIRVPDYSDWDMNRIDKVMENLYADLKNTKGWFHVTTDYNFLEE